MLIRLAIANLATIQSLQVELGEGFTVLTGETGAGKSILIDALRFVLGDKPSADRVRSGARETMVEATFEVSTLPEVRERLAELGIPCDGELVLRRIQQATGRSRAVANDSTLTQTALEQLGRHLVNIHGQHDHQLLLDRAFHIGFLDAFGGLEGEREALAEAYREHNRLTQQVRRLAEEAAAREARRAELATLIEAVRAAAPRPGEKEELRAELNRLGNAETLARVAHGAAEVLYEGEQTLHARLGELVQTLAEGARIDPALQELVDAAAPLRFTLEDLYRNVGAYAARIEPDPGRLEEVNGRLAELEKLERRFGGSLAAALAQAEAAEGELAALEQAEGSREQLERRRGEVAGGLHRLAERVSARRKEVATRLTHLISGQLRELGMDKATFQIPVEPLVAPSGKTPYITSTGMDGVEFLISTNPGQALRPLRRVASGGELSRVMLALKSILAATDPTPTLIFDEVDAGIGGATAEIVGNKLRGLGETHQVLCITHLPQIAALGHRHLLVRKEMRGQETFTSIAPLEGEEKVREVARLLSGLETTERSLASAEELISRGTRAEA